MGKLFYSFFIVLLFSTIKCRYKEKYVEIVNLENITSIKCDSPEIIASFESDAIASGAFGQLMWILYVDSTLIISGEDEIPNFWTC